MFGMSGAAVPGVIALALHATATVGTVLVGAGSPRRWTAQQFRAILTARTPAQSGPGSSMTVVLFLCLSCLCLEMAAAGNLVASALRGEAPDWAVCWGFAGLASAELACAAAWFPPPPPAVFGA